MGAGTANPPHFLEIAMSLKHVRSLFVEVTGRADLDPDTNTAYEKNADFYLNMGQRWLDQQLANPKLIYKRSFNLAAGAFYAHFRGCRTLLRAWFADATARTRLEYKPIDWLRANYASMFDSIDDSLSLGIKTLATEVGTPLYWSPITIGMAPEQNEPNTNAFVYDNEGILPGDHYSYKGIMVFPAAETAGTLSVFGSWFSPELVDENSKSFWTEVHPDILVYAAAMKLEAMYRNTQGMNDWRTAAMDALVGIDNDVAIEQSEHIYNMEGMDPDGPVTNPPQYA